MKTLDAPKLAQLSKCRYINVYLPVSNDDSKDHARLKSILKEIQADASKEHGVPVDLGRAIRKLIERAAGKV